MFLLCFVSFIWRWFNGFNWEGLKARSLPSPLKRAVSHTWMHPYMHTSVKVPTHWTRLLRCLTHSVAQAGASKSRPWVKALWPHISAANRREAGRAGHLLLSDSGGFSFRRPFRLHHIRNGISVVGAAKSSGFVFNLEEETSSCSKEKGVGPPDIKVEAGVGRVQLCPGAGCPHGPLWAVLQAQHRGSLTAS